MRLDHIATAVALVSALSTSALLADDLPHRFTNDECDKMLAGMDTWFDKFEADRAAGYGALDLIDKMIEGTGGDDPAMAKNLSELRVFVEQVSTPPDIAATNGDLTIRNKCPRRKGASND